MNRKNRKTKIHFIGIGGIGMSGIATVLINQGYQVSGSDASESEGTRKLRDLGATIAIGHRASQVQDPDVVVISSAIKVDNPELTEAKKRKIPVIPRAEMLAELMRGKTGIAVAGTHGKTTTTSFLATLLTEAGLDPTLVIGGRVDQLGGNAKWGTGEVLVAEADESDGSFLHLTPTYGIVTNVDNDHLDHFGSMKAVEDAFVSFISKIPFYGMTAVCGEDPGVMRILNRVSKPFRTYGWSDRWDYWAKIVARTDAPSIRFEVWTKQLAKKEIESSEAHAIPDVVSGVLSGAVSRQGEIELSLPGDHHVLNALAATVIALELGVSFEQVRAGFKRFHGVKRRFETKWKRGKKWLLDDYGHHPTEISATLDAARAAWPGRIITVFQPHRYSRTLHCHDGFLTCFRKSDVTYLTDIYAAGESPIEGVSSERLVKDLNEVKNPGQTFHHLPGSLEQHLSRLMDDFKEGDLLLCMGAGTITRFSDQLVQRLSGQT